MKDFKMSAHENRSLLMSSMICLGIDSRLADFCLDHEQDKRQIHKFYLDLSYEAKTKAYEKYWEYLRKN